MYEDLNSAKLEDMMQANNKVVDFVNNKEFERTLPKECLCESVNVCISEYQYQKEIMQFLKVLLPRMADGLSEQSGALLGFGPM